MGVSCREGMRKGGVRLLEPIMKVEVVTPEEHMGDVIGDLTARRGIVNEFLDKPGSLRLIRSFVPLAEMFSYISNLRGAPSSIRLRSGRSAGVRAEISNTSQMYICLV